MRHLAVWIVEFLKLLSRRRFHPLTTQCPICHQVVRLHVNRRGRQHVFEHARGLYEGARFSVHYAAQAKCVGSGRIKLFHPRPSERQHFQAPHSSLAQ
jgi:hypothetical protein